MLKVFVEAAYNVPKDCFRRPDPIVILVFRGEQKQTKCIVNDHNPVWKQLLEFDLKGKPLDYSSSLDVIVKDVEPKGNNILIGSTSISLKDFPGRAGRFFPFKGLSLMTDKGQPTGATIDLMISYEPPMSKKKDPNDPDNEDEVDGQTVNQIAGHLTKGKQTRSLNSNKAQDFQIRVKVIEGRQLSGSIIKPVVQVSVAGQTHRTRIKTGNNPYFDEMFFYNVNMTPSKLFDEFVILQLFNSRLIRSDSQIGEFKLDIGFIYNEPGHAVMRKWVLLNDPEDLSSGGKGYLKVSMFVIGTGDEPPAENKERDNEADDVESNLLLPSGMEVRWVTFLLKIYRAEDIPQMDDSFVQSLKERFGFASDKTNLVDPFVEVAFAGKKVCTETIKQNANPEWNQAVNLQIKFPSMCQNIRLTVYDWDTTTRNDAIGTTILSLSKIASSGGELEANGDKQIGFLPTFGPCYLNLYGSPREFTRLCDPYDDLNLGKGEGVAYRGRLLLELTTKLDDTPSKEREEILRDDILTVEKYQHRKKFSLCAIFHSATMLQDIGEDIQFEVSIGNYGNKFDRTCKPLPSTTQYSHAVFDGNHYYYLPWSNPKPVVTLTSYWEDICHRLDVVNILQAMMERLQSNISALKSAIEAKIPETKEIWLKLTDQVIEDAKRPLPSLEGKSNVTKLDTQLYKLRQTSLKLIGKAAARMNCKDTDINSTLTEIEDWLEKLQQISEEPQNSMPDVIIWMIRAEKRLAYARVPAHQILFSSTGEEACGKYCGKTQTIFLQYPMDKNKGRKIPAQLQINMWLGLSAVEEKFNSFAEGTFSVFTEKYESKPLNSETSLMKGPRFSDVAGTIKLVREFFLPPKGWQWDGDFIVDPEWSLLTEADAGHSEFTDEIFEHESRNPCGDWKPSDEPYTDVNGGKSCSPGEFECRNGWVWEDDWIPDINRAVDEEGWEYGIAIPPDNKPKSWVAAEKMYHTHRRRRLVRKRRKDLNVILAAGMPMLSEEEAEGWEYAPPIGRKQNSDDFRYRRLRKKMIPTGSIGACAIFKLEGTLGTCTSGEDEEEKKSSEKGKESATNIIGASTPIMGCVGSLLTEADAGHSEFTDEIFQNESRYPGGDWKLSDEPYTDVNGEKSCSPGEIECQNGWVWEDDAWINDINRAVDEEGWEYGIAIPPDNKPKSWVAAEKMYYTHRRRRQVRKRKRDPNVISAAGMPMLSQEEDEGWEYAPPIGRKFHLKKRSSDAFHRRRWRRKMAPTKNIGACPHRRTVCSRRGPSCTPALELCGAPMPPSNIQLPGADTSCEDKEKSSEKEKESATNIFGANTPIVSCTFDRVFSYHLRCYIYQARNLTPMDRDSFSDPYAHVSFLHCSKTTETIHCALNPTWDQTIIFNEVEIYGDPLAVAENPPYVVVEIFDHDLVGKDEFLGRSMCSPSVKLNPGIDITPKLLLYPVMNADKKCGEILMTAELILPDKDGSNLPIEPSQRAPKLYMVPQGIRPVVQLTAVEILTWGLRNMQSYLMTSVTSPSLIVECSGESVQSAVIKNLKKTPNFSSSVLFMKVLLPKEEMYVPPIVIKVIDHRLFGREPVVGQCTINGLERFHCDPYAARMDNAVESKVALMSSFAPRDVIIDVEDSKPLLETQPKEKEEEIVDWWSKYYSSIGQPEKCGQYLQKGYDSLKVYDCELEKVPEFSGLVDFCETFKLYRGKSEDGDDPSVVGEFKGSFRIYPLSDDPSIQAPPRQFRELPDSGPQECLVRIYIIRGIDLQPKDSNGLCDPYIKITLSQKVIEDRDNYIANTLNPVFGRMYELSCFLPQEKDLNISVYDRDTVGRDEKVGETTIDLENRFLSRFGSHCGLPQTYCVSGINQWRDQMKPSEILQNVARLKAVPPPVYSDNGIKATFEGREYSLEDLEANKKIHQHLGPANERLALFILRGQGLVPEHVETRTLYSTFQPNILQGKLEMWVDLFPKSLGPPGPRFNILPRKAKKYVLRVIVWNTKDVLLNEKSITGEKMSDIYVKGWIPGIEENKQKTDVHYRSLDGEGNFNWRFVFPFEYLPAEQLCVISEKEHFWSHDKTELKFPPKLLLQIWDNDKFSLDDYLGFVELDLHRTLIPAKTPEKCTLAMTDLPKISKVASLFEQKSMRGWWPCYAEKDGDRILAGKVELTLEVLNEKEAEERPAGKGRDEPNMNPKLDPPNRLDTSILWFTNPWKTMKFIVWRRFKWVIIGIIIVLLLLLFFGEFLYSLLGYYSMKIVKPNV